MMRILQMEMAAKYEAAIVIHYWISPIAPPTMPI